MEKRTELGIPSTAFVITHVGGMIELRDQSVILRAVRQCIETGINAYLVLVGDGPLRRRLEAEKIELGLSQRARFLGYRGDVVELNAMSDVYVNMAREEGFGIAVVEAMQGELPVILANTGSLPELIEDGVSGLLVPAGDAAGLVSALQWLANDAVLRKRIGEEAKRRANNIFSISRYVKDTENLYAEVYSRSHDLR
jgi:glycosyltransferase involved in cell wall biosynthesis